MPLDHFGNRPVVVENPGNDPGYPDFQSGAYTMFANSPSVEIKGLEPLTDTV